jgi:hypothetical protein
MIQIRGCLVVLFYLFGFFPKSSLGQNKSVELIQKVESRPTRVGLSSGFASFSLSTSENNLNALFAGITFNYAIEDRFGFLANFEQAFSVGSLIEVGGTFSLLGSMKPQTTTLELGSRPVVKTESFSPFVVHFINTGARVIGLAGAGGGVAVDFLSVQGWGISSFFRVCYTTNPELTAIPYKIGIAANLNL